ncbi:MAG: MerR family transcriptional regulator [Rhodocyclaceae bacterium]|nr:MerR family transcriptional regulator [Rhodocyclaceae bacterium]
MMTEEIFMGSAIETCWMTLEEAADLLAVEPGWLAERLAAGFLPDVIAEESRLGFPPPMLTRVRRLAWMEREFDAVPELAALVCDLEEEIARLKARLALLAP